MYICTCVFLLHQESFDMILDNNPSFYDQGVISTVHRTPLHPSSDRDDDSLGRLWGELFTHIRHIALYESGMGPTSLRASTIAEIFSALRSCSGSSVLRHEILR
jgi:hypothetical protein